MNKYKIIIPVRVERVFSGEEEWEPESYLDEKLEITVKSGWSGEAVWKVANALDEIVKRH